jgi:hypothetical protein
MKNTMCQSGTWNIEVLKDLMVDQGGNGEKSAVVNNKAGTEAR